MTVSFRRETFKCTELQKCVSFSCQQGTWRVNKPLLLTLFINLTLPLFSHFILKSWHRFCASLTVLGPFPPEIIICWKLLLPSTAHIPIFVLVPYNAPCLAKLCAHSNFIALLLFQAHKAGFHSAALACQDEEQLMEAGRKSRWAQPPGEQGFATRNPRWEHTPCVLFSPKPKCFCLGCLFVSQVIKKPLVPIMCHYGGVSTDSVAKVNLRRII